MKRIKTKKRAKGDDQLKANLPALQLQVDQSSLENNTNCDWKRQRKVEGVQHLRVDHSTKPITVQDNGVVEEINAHQFYEQSLYFMDTLQQEFCTITNDNWLEFKEPVPLDFLEDDPTEAPMKEGKWAPDEHYRFLEALRFHGKDWEKIEKHVSTRNANNIRSHAQKFLVKLVKILEKGKAVKGLSPEEALYYYGILNRKLHRSTLERLQREEIHNTRLQPKQIFKIEKVREEIKLDLEKLELSEGGKSPTSYNRWRQEAVSNTGASFTFNVKVRASASVNQKAADPSIRKTCLFSFKSMINEEQKDVDMCSSDSADSQSYKHHDRYSLDEYYPPGYRDRISNFSDTEDLMDEFFDHYEMLIYLSKDLPDRDTIMCMQIGERGPVFDVSRMVNKQHFMSDLHEFSNSYFIRKLPNLYANKIASVQEMLESIGTGTHSLDWPMCDLDKFVFSLALYEPGRCFLSKKAISRTFVTASEYAEMEAEFNTPYQRIFGHKNDELLNEEEVMLFLEAETTAMTDLS